MSTRAFLLAVGSPIAILALFAALQEPVLFLYYGGLLVLAIGASGFVAAHHFRRGCDEAVDNLARERRQHKAEADALAATVRTAAGDIARLEAECNSHAATNAALVAEAALTDPATGTTVRVPLLRVVPAQRDGSEYEWPAIVRAVEGEVSE